MTNNHHQQTHTKQHPVNAKLLKLTGIPGAISGAIVCAISGAIFCAIPGAISGAIFLCYCLYYFWCYFCCYVTNSHHQQTHKKKHPVNAKIDWDSWCYFWPVCYKATALFDC